MSVGVQQQGKTTGSSRPIQPEGEVGFHLERAMVLESGDTQYEATKNLVDYQLGETDGDPAFLPGRK